MEVRIAIDSTRPRPKIGSFSGEEYERNHMLLGTQKVNIKAFTSFRACPLLFEDTNEVFVVIITRTIPLDAQYCHQFYPSPINTYV